MLMLHSEQHCQITNFTFSYVFEYWTGNNGMMHKKMIKNCEMVTWRQIGWCVHWLTHVFAVGKVWVLKHVVRAHKDTSRVRTASNCIPVANLMSPETTQQHAGLRAPHLLQVNIPSVKRFYYNGIPKTFHPFFTRIDHWDNFEKVFHCIFKLQYTLSELRPFLDIRGSGFRGTLNPEPKKGWRKEPRTSRSEPRTSENPEPRTSSSEKSWYMDFQPKIGLFCLLAQILGIYH